MDNVNKLTLDGIDVPERLRQISSPPKKLFIIGAPLARKVKGANEAEQAVLALLVSGLRDGDILSAESGLEVALFNQTLTMLEITGKIRSLGGGQWSLA